MSRPNRRDDGERVVVRVAKRRNPLGIVMAALCILLSATSLMSGSSFACVVLLVVAWAFTLVKEDAER